MRLRYWFAYTLAFVTGLTSVATSSPELAGQEEVAGVNDPARFGRVPIITYEDGRLLAQYLPYGRIWGIKGSPKTGVDVANAVIGEVWDENDIVVMSGCWIRRRVDSVPRPVYDTTDTTFQIIFGKRPDPEHGSYLKVGNSYRVRLNFVRDPQPLDPTEIAAIAQELGDYVVRLAAEEDDAEKLLHALSDSVPLLYARRGLQAYDLTQEGSCQAGPPDFDQVLPFLRRYLDSRKVTTRTAVVADSVPPTDFQSAQALSDLWSARPDTLVGLPQRLAMQAIDDLLEQLESLPAVLPSGFGPGEVITWNSLVDPLLTALTTRLGAQLTTNGFQPHSVSQSSFVSWNASRAESDKSQLGTVFSFGVARVGGDDDPEQEPFASFALKFYRNPVDKSAPEPYGGFGGHLSLMLGVAVKSRVTYRGQEQAHLLAELTPTIGLGYDLNTYFTLYAGVVFFRQAPAVSGGVAGRIKRAPFISLGFDADAVNKIGDLLKKVGLKD